MAEIKVIKIVTNSLAWTSAISCQLGLFAYDSDILRLVSVDLKGIQIKHIFLSRFKAHDDPVYPA